MYRLLVRCSCSALLVLALLPACSSGHPHPRSSHLGPIQESRYLVSQRDTLESIAKAFSTTTDWLKKRNQVDEQTLSPGQVLIVPAERAQPWRDKP